jgi:hypothetical protein
MRSRIQFWHVMLTIGWLALVALVILVIMVLMIFFYRPTDDPIWARQTIDAIYATNTAVFRAAEGAQAARTATAQASPQQ